MITTYKDYVYVFSLFFFFILLHCLNISFLWGIDFLLTSLLFLGFFLDSFILTIASVLIIIMNTLLSSYFHLPLSSLYILMPLIAQRITQALHLNFIKHTLICYILIFFYTLAWAIALRLGIKDLSLLILKNSIVFSLCYFLFNQLFAHPHEIYT